MIPNTNRPSLNTNCFLFEKLFSGSFFLVCDLSQLFFLRQSHLSLLMWKSHILMDCGFFFLMKTFLSYIHPLSTPHSMTAAASLAVTEDSPHVEAAPSLLGLVQESPHEQIMGSETSYVHLKHVILQSSLRGMSNIHKIIHPKTMQSIGKQ